MILRRYRFVRLLPVGQDRTLIVHAISHMRLPAAIKREANNARRHVGESSKTIAASVRGADGGRVEHLTTPRFAVRCGSSLIQTSEKA
jgi:hypothetical protein